MIDESEGSRSTETVSFANDIATAPGDLPMPDVIARFNALAWQFRHDNTIEPLMPSPHEPVRISATSGLDMPILQAALYYTTDGSEPHVGSARVDMDRDGVEWNPHGGFLTRWRAAVPGQPPGTVVRYRLGGWRAGAPLDGAPHEWANDGQGFWFRHPGTKGITTFAYVVEPPRDPLPDWMKDAVIYHIFLDRFHPGTGNGAFGDERGPRERHGGTLRGVRQALPYLTELGVTCLWLSPLGPSETYHRYDTMDYFGVDPELGTAHDLHELIDEAHRRNIRIWLDFVPSHASWHHPAFQAAQRDRSAPSYSWFTFDEWPHRYHTFMQMTRYLPAFNTDDPGAREHLIDAARFWLREFDVDGYRIDHVIWPSMDFWVALRTATEAVKQDAVLIGEATDTPDSLRRYAGRLHGILDFPLARALRHTFGAGDWSVARLDAFLHAYERYMSGGPGRVSFLDNHDMDRFLWVAGNDSRRLKMAAICQFTLEATPTVYYGTEIGMTQVMGAGEAGSGGDAQARRDMPWDETGWDRDLLTFYRSLIRLRRDEPALRRGDRRTVYLDAASGTYAYLQAAEGAPSPASAIVTAFNLSEEEHEIRVALPIGSPHPSCLLATGAGVEIQPTDDGASITLAPMTAAIFRV